MKLNWNADCSEIALQRARALRICYYFDMILLFTRRASVVIHDTIMVASAWWLALLIDHALRGAPFTLWPPALILSLPLVLLAQAPFLWGHGLYRGIWRFASLPDLWNITRAVFSGTLALLVLLSLPQWPFSPLRVALLWYLPLLIFLIGIPRLAYRLWRDGNFNLVWQPPGAMRVLILGAGRGGETLARDMLRGREYQVVGFLDDQPRLSGGRIHGIPVLGEIARLPELAQKYQAELLVIAVPSATDLAMQRMVELCELTGVPFRILPRLAGAQTAPAPRASSSTMAQLRDVSIEDLLGRQGVQLDWEAIADGVRGKIILVSGGGGSIGAELCCQIARFEPARLIVLERCEFNLYQIEMRLQQEYPRVVTHMALGDVCDGRAVEHLLATLQPQLIFHAAAYKHVPLLQGQTRAAVRNNIFGTITLAQAACCHGCEQFVLISTDKAVNPANVMGATKRAAELYCQALNDDLLRGNPPGKRPTRFITVRFGNVLGSTGSVVPLFRQQIAQGGPVTVTHPEISRYFMTTQEACQLILQAGAMGIGGEIFVLDMGTPIKIQYLAEQLIRLAGKTPNQDIQIIYTGLRPGEKLHEELFHAEEQAMSKTRHQKILLAASRKEELAQLLDKFNQLQSASEAFDEVQLLGLLRQIVPEYHDEKR